MFGVDQWSNGLAQRVMQPLPLHACMHKLKWTTAAAAVKHPRSFQCDSKPHLCSLTASRLAAQTNGAMAVSLSVVDVKHRLSLQDGAFLLYVESAVPLFALALKVGNTQPHASSMPMNH